MILHARALAATLALAALPWARAADAPPAPPPKLTAKQLQALRESVAGRPLLVAMAPAMQVGPDQSWIYREDTQADGQHDSPSRTEVMTAFQNRHGDWLAASRSLSDTPVPAARMTARVDGCLVDLFDGTRLQVAPCSLPSPGDAWAIGPNSFGQRSEFKAVAREAVQVPVGSFEALRIEQTDFRPMVRADGTRAPVASSRSVYWYAPATSAMVRVERDVLRPDGTVAMHTVRVLEYHGPASEDAKQAIRAMPEWAANERAKEAHARIMALQGAMPPLSQHATVAASSLECRPKYPAAAIRAGATGQTQLALLVGADGSVQASEVTVESGPTLEHQLLDAAALASLSTCPCKPALGADGKPTALYL